MGIRRASPRERFVAYLAGKLEGVRGFQAARGKRCGHIPARSNFRRSSKKAKGKSVNSQRQTGFDLYWRVYFALA